MSDDDARYRYYLTEGDNPEREVDKAEFVSAERRAGFNNTMGQQDEPATAGFGGPAGDTLLRGRMVYVPPGCIRQACGHPESKRPGFYGHCSHASCANYLESCLPHQTPVPKAAWS